jgi:hypothetical protein
MISIPTYSDYKNIDIQKYYNEICVDDIHISEPKAL